MGEPRDAEQRPRRLRILLLLSALLLTTQTPALLGVNGEIVDQQISGGEGYTVLRVWGGHYDMGYAHAWLMHGEIADMVSDMKSLIGTYYYNALRSTIGSDTIWKPDETEDELDGMVDALAVQEPAAGIDKVDLKIVNTYSDFAYGGFLCRSHSCWGHFVDPPITTLSTRRLDFSTPVPAVNHHVLCVWLPTDGTPAWANMAWAGYVAAVTAVSEFGTLSSLHDYNCGGSVYFPCLPRSVAARYVLTMVTDPDPSTHAADVFAALQSYDAGTGSFINYYVPDGNGAVITCRRSPRPTFCHLRTPQSSYFGGDVILTTNAWTDGTYTPSDDNFMAPYYQNLESTSQTATQLSHWNLMGNSGLHKMTIAHRDRGDLTVWVDGRLSSGRTPRVELEWTDLDSRRELTLGLTNRPWGTVDVDPNQVVYEPNQTVTLTACPIPSKSFKYWEVYDPNHPGDANYVALDTNDVLTLVMDADWEVTAVFECGSSGILLLLGVGLLMVVGMALRWRR